MTAISADGRALSVVCDGCGMTVRHLDIAAGRWDPAWSLMRDRGWTGSSLAVGAHYCARCQLSDDDDLRPHRPSVHPALSPGREGWLSVEQVDGVAVLSIGGECDIRVDAAFSYALARAADTTERVLLGMANVDLIDSTIIRTLVRAQQRLAADGGVLALLQPPPRVRRILDVLGLAELFPVYTDLDEALARMRPAR
jgi:anti-anti-sigma factor